MKGFVRDFYLRPSCYECKYKTLHRESDITLADFWGIEANVPELDDNKGTSLIFVNSDKGKDYFEKIKGKIIFRIVDIDKSVTFNPSAYKSCTYTRKKKNFYKKYKVSDFNLLIEELMKENSLKKIVTFSNRVKDKIKRMISG